MIQLQDNTKRPEQKIVPVYVNNRPRVLGLFHFLDLGGAAINKLDEYGFAGVIHHAIMCTCMAPKIPYHIKPVAKCLYLKIGRWFVTVRIW